MGSRRAFGCRLVDMKVAPWQELESRHWLVSDEPFSRHLLQDCKAQLSIGLQHRPSVAIAQEFAAVPFEEKRAPLECEQTSKRRMGQCVLVDIFHLGG